ncbi:MAG: signal recognition particle-docking protein FtsY [Thermodesulfobacteriota bacterium]|nr:signal recognition particle-docking protein FtsY [Thermodesulfobacteriota bacterium]
MPTTLENIQIFLLTIPVSYLLALLGLLVLLLVLLIARRKKSQARPDVQVPPQPAEIKSTEALEIPEPPSVTDREIPDEVESPAPEEAIEPETASPRTVAPAEPDVSQPDLRPVQQAEPVEAIIEPPAPEAPTEPHVVVEKPDGIFARLKKGLSKTRQFLNTDIDQLFQGRKKIDDELLEELEELLITADIGVQTALDLIEQISHHSADIMDANQLKGVLKAEIRSLLKMGEIPETSFQSEVTPHVIMVVGVNGVGKTTTIGKLAAHYTGENKKVLIAAADTFRAAAVEQVTIWAQRSKADLVHHKDGSDPAAVAFDGVDAGVARGCDVVLIDTAGRLHTKVNLMEELKKIKRSVNKKLSGAPHEILLVLDATTGQNAVSQAKTFHEALDITGIALTKLDGTAKGGIVISIVNTLNVPLKYIGVGEQIDDLQIFNTEKFVDALF